MTEIEIMAAATAIKSGGGTIASIAAGYNVHPRTLKRYFKERKISARPDPAAMGAVGATVVAQVQKYLAGGSLAEHTKIVIETRESKRKAASFFSRLLVKLHTEAIAGGDLKNVALIQNAVKTLLMSSQTLKNLTDIEFKALGIVDEQTGEDDELPDLWVHVMDNEQVAKIAKERETLGDDLALPGPGGLDADLPDLADDLVEEGEDAPAVGKVADGDT